MLFSICFALFLTKLYKFHLSTLCNKGKFFSFFLVLYIKLVTRCRPSIILIHMFLVMLVSLSHHIGYGLPLHTNEERTTALHILLITHAYICSTYVSLSGWTEQIPYESLFMGIILSYTHIFCLFNSFDYNYIVCIFCNTKKQTFWKKEKNYPNACATQSFTFHSLHNGIHSKINPKQHVKRK